MAGSTVHSVRIAEGVQMPLLGLGVYQIHGDRTTADAVSTALEAGYRHIDTAALYRNEAGVGAGLRASGVPREEVFVTTKFLPRAADPARELETSLRKLGMDYVDLYLIHWPTGAPTKHWDVFETFVAKGLARSVGVSNYGGDGLRALVSAAGVPPAVNQIEFNPYAYRRRLVETCTETGVVAEAYSPLRQGGGMTAAPIAAAARKHGKTEAQVMLRWALQRDTVVIPKSVRPDRIRSNAEIFDFTLDADDLAALDGLDRTGGTDEAN
jgi:diketogulonate reductase-like aldo/keto reductase